MNIEFIKARSRIIGAIRRFFDERGFIEVDTPVRIAAPAPEPHIDCPPVSTGGFLRASPELQMKKLLAEGLDKIYQIGPCFRDGERGSRHNPEFTMLEWYRRDATYRDIADDLTALLAQCRCLDGAQCKWLSSAQCRWLSCAQPIPLSVRDAYIRFAGWDPWQGAWDGDRFDFDMATKIEPALKNMGCVFLTDYPPQCASLAKISGDIAERWEFYFNGLELANCFTELCEGAEQRRRFDEARDERRSLAESDYPIDNDFLDRLDSIKSAAGVALGIDRLVMCLTGATDISAVRTQD